MRLVRVARSIPAWWMPLAALFSSCGISESLLERSASPDASGEGAPAAIDAPEEMLPLADAAPEAAEDSTWDADMSPDELNLSAGQAHTCERQGGGAFCWGANSTGALGSGDSTARNEPSLVVASSMFAQVSCGEAHTCACDRQGGVWCWGGNQHGELGTGALASTFTPARVVLETAALKVRTGFSHTCALLLNHTLWCWGENEEGQLGQGDFYPGVDARTPIQVGRDSDWSDVALGQGHTCALKQGGTLWCWGRNSEGELGLGETAADQTREPMQVGEGRGWTSLALGQASTCGLRSGELFCWGTQVPAEADAALPLQSRGPVTVGLGALVPLPSLSTTSAAASKVTVNTFGGCVITAAGVLGCWGRNAEGQLGTGDTTDRPTLTRVGSDIDWAEASAGRFHLCARKRDGRTFCTGANSAGELGVGDNERRNLLTSVR